jgi:hypothetical protein
MNLIRLREILRLTTIQLRKGDIVRTEAVGSVDVVHIDLMPHESEAREHLELIDLEFLTIGVDKAMAGRLKAELIAILKTYPNPESLRGGPSYITVGAEIGDQGAAFQLFALGKVLDLWDLVTPATFKLTGEEAKRAAGIGFIMITGFDGEKYST